MSPKPFNEICSVCMHAAAVACAIISLYFFFSSSVEVMLGAILTLGAAVALEVIAAVVHDEPAAHA